MSWDIFVQNLPLDIKSSSDVMAVNLPATRSQIIMTIKEIVPFADFSNPAWGILKSGKRCLIDVNLGKEESLKGFAFHVYGGDLAGVVVAEILQRLSLRALDPTSDSGFFEPEAYGANLEKWREYRAEIVSRPSST